MDMVALVFALLAGLGLVQCLVGWFFVVRFAGQSSGVPTALPPITILRPMCGVEPLLEEALVTCFSQDYPDYQIVFGLQDPSDPALEVLNRVKERFPDRDIAIVVDTTSHGPNRKVGNLINMLPAAKHEILVISDSDLHLPANYLERLAVELEKPNVGMVSCLYVGHPPADRGIWERLGATQITHAFLPGVLISRAMGRQDCLGSTAMMTKETLARIGGFEGLVELLAEDNVMGQRVRALGLDINLADTVVATTVPESQFRSLWLHETRWTRTIRILAPYALIASTLQYPLFWSALSVIVSGGASWAVMFFLIGWLIRAIVSGGIDDELRFRLGTAMRTIPVWIYPVRDILSVVEIIASYSIDEVIWRGHKFNTIGQAEK